MSREAPLLRVITVGLWWGLALAAARCVVIYGMDHVVRGHDVETALFRVSGRLARTTWIGVAAGVFAALAFARVRPRFVALLGAAFLALAVVSGWPHEAGLVWSDRYHVPDLRSARGRESLGALAAAAVVAALVLGAAVRHAPRIASGPLATAAGLLFALIMPPAFERVVGQGDEMELREVVLELPRVEDRWRIIEQSETAPPRAGVITTATDFKVDGGDLPALVMPPPCTIEFEVTEAEGAVTLAASAGVDRSALEALAPDEEALSFRFEVLVNGETRFDETVSLARGGEQGDRAWRRVGGRDGLALEPGDVVRLSTKGPLESGSEGPWPAGFGRLTLERRTTASRTRSSPDAPNIVLVVMDTLRADRTSLYGYPKRTTPNLERLAARGLTFDEARSTSSWTWPATASILTGLLSEEHGVKSASACHLASEVETLAEVLQRRGYTTAAFIGNPLIVADKNFDQGFEHFSATKRVMLFTEMIFPDLAEWIERRAGTRFFVYAHLVDPHEPYRPLPRFLEEFAGERPAGFPDHGLTKYAELMLAAQRDPDATPADVVPDEHKAWMDGVYDAAVASADFWLGELLDLLDELDLTDETIIAFTSDHGEELFDHGMLKHGHAVHAELVHVPLVLAGPGIATGARVDTPVSNRHLAGTLARFGGAELARARDFLDLARVDGLERRPILYSTYAGWLRGERDRALLGLFDKGYVLHVERDGKGDASVLGLYDAERDPLETTPLADDGRAAELKSRALERAMELEARAPREQAGGAATLDMLRGIGYAGDDE